MRGRNLQQTSNSDSLYAPIIDALLRPQRLAYSVYSLPAALTPTFEDGSEGSPIERVDEELTISTQTIGTVAYSSTNNRTDHSGADVSSSDSLQVRKNKPGEITLFISSYLVPHMTKEVVIYLHTHSGMRVEGVDIARRAVAKGFGAVLYDSRGNGHSTGSSVSFGWNEAADLEAVILHLRNHHGVKSIFLWGRSMGAATSIFYQSPKFRASHPISFPYLYPCVKGLILDSPFTDLRENIKTFVSSKASAVPGFVVDIALGLVEKDIKTEIGVSLSSISPVNFFDGLRLPTLVITSDQDEMVKLEEIEALFRNVRSNVKKLRISRGSHSEERPESIMKQGIDFVQLVFKLSRTREHHTITQIGLRPGRPSPSYDGTIQEPSTRIGQQNVIQKQPQHLSKLSSYHRTAQPLHHQKLSSQPFDRLTGFKHSGSVGDHDPFEDVPQRWAQDVTEVSEEFRTDPWQQKTTAVRDEPIKGWRQPLIEPTALIAYSNESKSPSDPRFRVDLMKPASTAEGDDHSTSARSKSYLVSKQARSIPIPHKFEHDSHPVNLGHQREGNIYQVMSNQTAHNADSNSLPSGQLGMSVLSTSIQMKTRDLGRRRSNSNVRINLYPSQPGNLEPTASKQQEAASKPNSEAKFFTKDFTNLASSDDSSEDRQRTNSKNSKPVLGREDASRMLGDTGRLGRLAEEYPDPFEMYGSPPPRGDNGGRTPSRVPGTQALRLADSHVHEGLKGPSDTRNFMQD